MQIGICSSTDLKILINLLPSLEVEANGTKQFIAENPEKFLSESKGIYTWHDYYELPFLEHIAHYINGLGLTKAITEISASPNPQKTLLHSPKANSAIEEALRNSDVLKSKGRHFVYALQISVFNSLRSLMAYGHYLNDLVAEARKGDVEALFRAIRIDPTVISTKTAATYLVLAETVDDAAFFNELKKALKGKLGKTENANFQKMRVVMRVLVETGAGRLTDDQLYKLFVEELRFYAANSKSRDVIKALRGHADKYMKVHATI